MKDLIIKMETLNGIKCLKKLLDSIVVCYPMNNFECKPSKDRNANYGAYIY